MSEEDAFLDGIAADRADRTRLLVFADWLADRSDPREEFVRLHAKLLDMDGTEPEFGEHNDRWKGWVGGTPFDYPAPARLSGRWLDALCRVYTAASRPAPADGRAALVNQFEYGPADHADRRGGFTTVLYHGRPRDFDSPLDFVVRALQWDWTDPAEFDRAVNGTMRHLHLTPLTRGGFWGGWRRAVAALADRPPVPGPAADNLFLGAQYVDSDPSSIKILAVHRDDYFALAWECDE